MLRALERRILWLSTWMIHHANHVRPNVDGLKVGGHQASSASVATLMTALYLDVLRPSDRVAVKPHASPVFHAIQYLLGRQTREKLERFRAFGGVQSYPSRTKDTDDVDISTGSVGLGVAMTTFAALVRDYLDAHERLGPEARRGRMVAIVGDAELDEGNVYEALLEGWKHDVRDLWWVIDYNRQSLDAVISDRLFGRFNRLFTSMGWDVVTIKYGKKLQEAFARPGGEALRQWIDACPNSLYSALVVKGGAAWRERVLDDIGARRGVRALVSEHDDAELGALMTNLGGHDMESVLEAFEGVTGDRPTCFLAYTIKGFGLPFAGHKDNHSGLMSPDDVEAMRVSHGVARGEEWEQFSGMDVAEADVRRFLAGVPFNQWVSRRPRAASVPVPAAGAIAPRRVAATSTQETFGRVLDTIARAGGPLADRIVTTSPDVTVSTNLGGWVNRRRLFHRKAQEDMFSKEQVGSFQRWTVSPKGQHMELGIAEHNLFLMLAAAGLSHSLFGERLIPIGTVYDPFIERGLDAFNYALYQDARFILVATPSGITLAPEGGAHQSTTTPLIGMGKDHLSSFEPAFADELLAILRWAFRYVQSEGEGRERSVGGRSAGVRIGVGRSTGGWSIGGRGVSERSDEGGVGAEPGAGDLLNDGAGGSVYLRLSTRKVDQPERALDAALEHDILAGAYWMRPPADGSSLAIVYTGAVAPEAMEAHVAAVESNPGAGLLAVTSADRLWRGWGAAQRARRTGTARRAGIAESAGAAEGCGNRGERRRRVPRGDAARTARARCAARHRHRWASGHARLARLGAGASGRAPRRRPVRPVGVLAGSVPRARHRGRGDSRRLRFVTTRFPHGVRGCRRATSRNLKWTMDSDHGTFCLWKRSGFPSSRRPVWLFSIGWERRASPFW